jgi:hypothetical protein
MQSGTVVLVRLEWVLETDSRVTLGWWECRLVQRCWGRLV